MVAGVAPCGVACRRVSWASASRSTLARNSLTWPFPALDRPTSVAGTSPAPVQRRVAGLAVMEAVMSAATDTRRGRLGCWSPSGSVRCSSAIRLSMIGSEPLLCSFSLETGFARSFLINAWSGWVTRRTILWPGLPFCHSEAGIGWSETRQGAVRPSEAPLRRNERGRAGRQFRRLGRRPEARPLVPGCSDASGLGGAGDGARELPLHRGRASATVIGSDAGSVGRPGSGTYAPESPCASAPGISRARRIQRGFSLSSPARSSVVLAGLLVADVGPLDLRRAGNEPSYRLHQSPSGKP